MHARSRRPNWRLRDLKGLSGFEPSQQQRASQMAALLIEARDTAAVARAAGLAARSPPLDTGPLLQG